MENIQPAKYVPRDHGITERTGNNAIDLVSQCVGFHKSMGVPLKAVVLSPNYYNLFVEGCRVMADKAGYEFDVHAELTFQKVFVRKGALTQLDLIRPILKK